MGEQGDTDVAGHALTSVVGVGDIMLGRDVTTVVARQGRGVLGDALSLLCADVVTGNLECVITSSESGNPNSHSRFKVDARVVQPIISLFDVVCLANNHIYDFMDRGIQDTLNELDAMGVLRVGVGCTPAEARAPVTLETPGGPVAVLAASTAVCVPPGRSEFHVARPDAAFLRQIELAAQSASLVIVHLHAGGGDYPYPSPDVRRLHDSVRAAGARLVLGHHPHVIQGWLEEPNAISLFGLGDFIFDRFEDGRAEALIARCEASPTTIDVTVTCVMRAADLVLGIASGEDRIECDERVGRINAAIANGSSDTEYLDIAGSQFASMWRESLSKDMSAGGVRAILSRLRRATPSKIWRTLRLAARSASRNSKAGGRHRVE